MDSSLLSLGPNLSQAEIERLSVKIWKLLAKQTDRYCMGDSSSVPVETARELLRSLCFTLRFEMDTSGITPEQLLEKDLWAVVKDGQKHLEEKVAKTKALWARVYSLAEAAENGKILEALRLLARFFEKYDFYFFAHQTPWDMGLLLPGPAAGQRQGIGYAQMYLMGLYQFLRKQEGKIRDFPTAGS